MKYDEEDGWTFFTLNGCPAELVMFMARLAVLASTYEKVRTMEWAMFNTFPVEEIIRQTQKWENNEDATAESISWTQDDPETRRNKFHCVEAWRNAIQLYAYRVFYRPQTSEGLRSITHLARVVLDHVRCIPDTAVAQKQTLLPVFLAASEVGDEATRDFVRQFCIHWSSTARYSMFETVATLLETIWDSWDVTTRDVYWWGSKVGNNNSGSAGEGEGLISEFLFG
ncbi:uncharacterized protein A1O9_10630 [Exophiala aquamarina CBS 119918]|uniref:Uncharacterized protein n=1 Tax=Exophiala aquamarina CBS 119918 TaxID=1182545 RepID=A0A072P0G9_9EURO|nr:uncharacterized protein A1O9_10630 [Exophiala aquamarina CBS 119918]KEF53182.1 hypothetical protein A1O9_10630 [Exophiala aquamarina CBS 119918]